MTSPSVRSRGVRVLRQSMRRMTRVADRVGPTQPLSRRLGDARSYWSGQEGSRWFADSHWRGGLADDVWLEVGTDHLAMFHRFAKALDRRTGLGVVVEWGCRGRANAIAFAPTAKKFIAEDVSAESAAECVRQIGAVCDTPTESLVIDIEQPEQAIAGLEETCDTFLCLYVLVLTAGPEEALRILRIAEQLLDLANMTTFGIDEFWLYTAESGLVPQLVTLVPENRLDSRYAYGALTKP